MNKYKDYQYGQKGTTWTVYNEKGKPWITDFETEEDAKEQIDGLVRQKEQAQNEKAELEQLKEQITELQLAMVESEA